MLLQIREFVQREKIASNQQIARAFSMDIHALEPLLAFWVRKGLFVPVQQQSGTACASRCASGHCHTQSVVYYQYHGNTIN
jgi:hypothetical protein